MRDEDVVGHGARGGLMTFNLPHRGHGRGWPSSVASVPVSPLPPISTLDMGLDAGRGPALGLMRCDVF